MGLSVASLDVHLVLNYSSDYLMLFGKFQSSIYTTKALLKRNWLEAANEKYMVFVETPGTFFFEEMPDPLTTLRKHLVL